MRRLKIVGLVISLTLLFQIIADHIIHTVFDRVSYLFVAAVPGGMGLLALLLVKSVFKMKKQ